VSSEGLEAARWSAKMSNLSHPKLNVVPLELPEVLVITPKMHRDQRGYFIETYSAPDFADIGIQCVFVQDNHCLSIVAGTVRGLHFQIPPISQAKLVRVLRGRIFDVAVDIRRGSPTYGHWCAATITAEAGEQFFVPHGFAHGYCTLEPDTEVAYKVDNYYSKERDAGLLWNDPAIGIVWPVSERAAVLSEKDCKLPRIANFESPFQFNAT
jgi:dTDP-4-dehydrorhamnose 3,5-epimerase